VVLERLAAHESWEAILSAYPELKKEDIQEAILYARSSLDHTEFRVVMPDALRLYLDQMFGLDVAAALHREGHDVLRAAETG